ncbi:hypothetical protein BV510_26225 [Mycolicibacterium diernhoferi]|uniref:Uncharacterized protein n=1 Tax=Mycolicibacterium diernhoferi TaxID=1801 RepID=A0A1T3VX43_9MYCO|nr:hypothetical protein BV510_26225 [Mycolicibacterium diernhoferi]
MATRLAADGNHVAVLDYNADAAEQVTAEIEAAGGRAITDIAVPPPGFGVGQLIVLLAAILIVAAAMAARELSAKVASSAALAISVIVAALLGWYFRLYVHTPVAVGYGMYLAVAMTVLAIIGSVATMVVAWRQTR